MRLYEIIEEIQLSNKSSDKNEKLLFKLKQVMLRAKSKKIKICSLTLIAQFVKPYKTIIGIILHNFILKS